MLNDNDEESVEETVRRYAYNRWQMRQSFKWKLHETDLDDWRIAEEMVREELVRKEMEHDI